MSKNIYIIIIINFLLLISCQSKSAINNDFNCDKTLLKNLEKVEDVKELFSINLPKNWKVNLYNDEIQSSIFTADTTKQLTESVLLDVTFIQKSINFNDTFLLQQEQENLFKNLIKIKSKEFIFLKKPSIFIKYKGKKGEFSYQICNIFIKVNDENFILAKTEVYGDSIINHRFCQALSLIENINLNQ